MDWNAAWLAEVDASASAVLAYRFPDIPNLGDMTNIAAHIDIGLVEAPDMLVGGTPCQGFSVAGRRGGLSDPRGRLTLSFVEIADAIDRSRRAAGQPECVVLWENVPGVLSMGDNAFGNFLAALAGEDLPLEPSGKRWADSGVVLGPERAIAWRTLDAQYVHLAQRRKRVFVVASARDGFDPGEVLLEFEGVRRDSPPSRKAGEDVASDADASVGSRSHWDGDFAHPTLNQSAAGSGGVGASNQEIFSQRGAYLVGDRLTNRVSREVFGGGNCSGPIAAAVLNARELYDFDTETFIVEPQCVTEPVTHCLKAEGFDASEDGTGRGQPIVHCYGLTTEQTPKFNEDCALTLTKQSPTGGGQIQSVAYGFQPRIARNGRGDMGDVVSALNAESGKTGRGDAAPCVAVGFVQNSRSEVRLMGGDGSVAGALAAETGAQQQTYVAANMAVRRLMPVECERLQGFPDGWTRIPVRHYPTRKLTDTRPADMWEPDPNGGWWLMAADGPRYKQLGNSMAVNVMAWIGRRIQRHLTDITVRNLIG